MNCCRSLFSRFRSGKKSQAQSQPDTAGARPDTVSTPATPAQPLTLSQPQPLVQNTQSLPDNSGAQRTIAAAGSTLTIALQNQTASSPVYAYISGLAIDNGGRWLLMQSDAVTPYYLNSPNAPMQPLPVNCAINLGAPGNTVQARIPHIAGGRIWFSIGQPLQFFVNPGPALVEPSVSNASDPNINTNWGFAEFTFNSDQLYANVSFVDFVGPPIALTLNTSSGQTQHVSGMDANGINEVANDLRAQHAQDGQGWDQLIINYKGTGNVLRCLSPVQGLVINPGLFSGYYDNYVNQVYARYQTQQISVDSQAAAGVVTGTSNGSSLVIGGNSFGKPSTRDIWSCSTGPFQTGGNANVNAIIPRLAAAFNRSTLLVTNTIPAPSNLYYTQSPTNHYSRIVHLHTLDHRGYGFPYDDVQPSGAPDQSGKVQAGNPTLFTVTVGGRNAYA